jgi:hypothetical protein
MSRMVARVGASRAVVGADLRVCPFAAIFIMQM